MVLMSCDGFLYVLTHSLIDTMDIHTRLQGLRQSCDVESKKTALAVVRRVLTHTDKPTSNKPMKVERAILIVKHNEHISKS